MNTLLESRLVDMLKVDEEFRSELYRCPAGKLTIGYGRNLEANGITETEASFLLEEDARRSIAAAKTLVSNWDLLGNARQAVLADMVFNLGQSGVRAFKRTIRAIKASDWSRAAAEMKTSQWFRQVGDRAERLVRMMETDTFEPYGG